MTYSDGFISKILSRTKVVAVVGMSAKPARPSYQVAQFLQDKGMRIIPVNPGLDGQTVLGETVYGALKDIPIDVDMVDIFRRSDAVSEIVDAALARWPDLPTIWTQLGVSDDLAAARATARGVDVIQNRCPKIEWYRHFSA